MIESKQHATDPSTILIKDNKRQQWHGTDPSSLEMLDAGFLLCEQQIHDQTYRSKEGQGRGRHAHFPSIAPGSSTGDGPFTSSPSAQAETCETYRTEQRTTPICRHSELNAVGPRARRAGVQTSRVCTHRQHLPSTAAKTPGLQARPSACGTECDGRAQRVHQALHQCSGWSFRGEVHVE